MDLILLPPQFVEHRLPANLELADNADFSPYSSYQTVPLILREFKRVAVSPDSVIYKNGKLLVDSVPDSRLKSYYRYRHLAKQIIFGRSVKLDPSRKYLLVTDLNSTGHFHWICEILPKLIAIKEECKGFILLLPDCAYLRNIGVQSLELLGFEFEDIVFMNRGSYYKAPRLFYIPSVSSTGLNTKLLEGLNRAFRSVSTGSGGKFYLSRRKAQFRKVTNDYDLIKFLAVHGFETVDAEDLSFRQQCEMFSAASVLAGIHGAGLANAVFMAPGSKMLELRKKENNTGNVAYWHLADSLGQGYYYCNGIPDSDLPLVGRGCNLTIPLNEIDGKLSGVL